MFLCFFFYSFFMSTLNTFLAPVAVVIVVFLSFLLLPQVSLLRFRIKNLCQAREVRCVCACVCRFWVYFCLIYALSRFAMYFNLKHFQCRIAYCCCCWSVPSLSLISVSICLSLSLSVAVCLQLDSDSQCINNTINNNKQKCHVHASTLAYASVGSRGGWLLVQFVYRFVAHSAFLHFLLPRKCKQTANNATIELDLYAECRMRDNNHYTDAYVCMRNTNDIYRQSIIINVHLVF